MPFRLLAVVAVLLLAGAACTDGGGAADTPSAAAAPATSSPALDTTSTTPAPSASASGTAAVPTPPLGRDPYLPPDPLSPGEPGELIWAEPLSDVPPGMAAWRVLYHSRSIDGADVAVSGVVAAPEGPAPAGGRPVLSWAHGTTGIADQCAPSREGVENVPLAQELVADGFVVVATDYEGLGTPGVHPYLVGPSQAHGVLDAARLAGELPTGASDRVLLWGYSQGGHAALWAAQLAADYAPELDVLGVVGGAPPSNLGSAAAAAEKPELAGFAALIGYAWAATYPEADLDLFTPEGRAALSVVEDGCVVDVITTFAAMAPPLSGDPLATEPWAALLAENSLGGLPVDVPVLLAQGTSDAIVAPASTEAYAAQLCAGGSDVELITIEGADHVQGYVGHLVAARAWLDARVAGEPTSPTC